MKYWKSEFIFIFEIMIFNNIIFYLFYIRIWLQQFMIFFEWRSQIFEVSLRLLLLIMLFYFCKFCLLYSFHNLLVFTFCRLDISIIKVMNFSPIFNNFFLFYLTKNLIIFISKDRWKEKKQNIHLVIIISKNSLESFVFKHKRKMKALITMYTHRYSWWCK